MKKEDGHSSKGTYVLTVDLGYKIKLFRYLGLKTPQANDRIFKDFQKELGERIAATMPDCQVRTINMRDLAEKILAKAYKKVGGLKNAVVVSSCNEIATLGRGYTIEINRVVDSEGVIKGIGPRPGYPAMSDQLNGIAAMVSGRPVVLVEDGSFTGNTMRYIVRKLKDRNVPVACIVLGFAFANAIAEIRKEYNGEIITIEEMKNIVDWMPDHDFVPFAPNCGRTFGISVNGSAYPFYTHDGAAYGIPYIKPFAPMSDWTSIPEKGTYDISIFCLQWTTDLFKTLGELNGRELQIRDIIGSGPARVTIPIAVGHKKFLEQLDRPVVDYLKSIYEHGILHLD